MKAVLLRETGGPDRLEYADVEEPSAEDGQALVRVRAAGINFLDVLIRQGRYPQPPPLPAVLGSEVAGEAAGRRVIGFTGGVGGGYAELATVDERWLVPLPDGIPFEEGAGFLLTFLTAWMPLSGRAGFERGATVLVHAAAGGVGTAAVQVAKYLGAHVIATASTDEKREFVRELGAEEAYGYDEFAEHVRADVIVDPVGGDVFAQSLKTLAPGGVLVAIGYAGGAWPDLDPALLVGRNVSVQGFYLGRLMGLRPDLVRAAIDELLPLWRDGAFRPVVGAVFPLAEASEAHRLIEERRHRGKVVLVP